MTRLLLLLAILTIQNYFTLLQSPVLTRFRLPAESVAVFQPAGLQDEKPLDREQIEDLLKIMKDENLAVLIRKQGIAFRLNDDWLDQLQKLGAGEKTKQALREKDELAIYREFSAENDPERRLILAKEFLRKYPASPNSTKVASELRRAEIAIFELEFDAFSGSPDAAGLDKVLALGRDLLKNQPGTATAVQVTSKLALATSKGVLGNFFDDLDQSREYANRTLKLMEGPPPPEINPQDYAILRTTNLRLVYQSLGLYQLRQPVPDPDQAISLLTRSIELASALRGGLAADDSITFWLRAMARDLKIRKLDEEYRALPKEQRVGSQGQSLCGAVPALIGQMINDYAHVIAHSARTDSPQLSQLRDQATEAINLQATGERPCTEGRAVLVEKLPDEEKRFALVIGVEDHLDKSAGKLNYAASDARAFADVLIRHGGFRKENVLLLAAGEAAERQPMRSVILKHLAELPDRIKQDGLLLIYFAGLSFERNGRSYLLAADSMMSSESLLTDTAISIDRLKEMIRAGGAGQVILFFDTFRREPAGESFSSQFSLDVKKNGVTAFAAFFSAISGQKAYESPANNHGVFTGALLEAGMGKAATSPRGVTLDDLIKYLEKTVPIEAKRESGAEQLPQAMVGGYEKGEVVMFHSSAAPAVGARKPTISDLISGSKTIQVRSKSIYMKKSVLESELRDLHEFQNLKMTIPEDDKEADIVIEIRLPFLTWNWNYVVLHRPTNTVLLTGNMKGITDGSVSPRLAKELVTGLLELRDSPPKSR